MKVSSNKINADGSTESYSYENSEPSIIRIILSREIMAHAIAICIIMCCLTLCILTVKHNFNTPQVGVQQIK